MLVIWWAADLDKQLEYAEWSWFRAHSEFQLDRWPLVTNASIGIESNQLVFKIWGKSSAILEESVSTLPSLKSLTVASKSLFIFLMTSWFLLSQRGDTCLERGRFSEESIESTICVWIGRGNFWNMLTPQWRALSEGGSPRVLPECTTQTALHKESNSRLYTFYVCMCVCMHVCIYECMCVYKRKDVWKAWLC